MFSYVDKVWAQGTTEGSFGTSHMLAQVHDGDLYGQGFYALDDVPLGTLI